MIKKSFWFIFGLLGLFVLTSCSSAFLQATSPIKPVIVDGNPDEWSLPLRYSDLKSDIQYTVTNDQSNIYVCIRAIEHTTQIKILSSGMEIWIDPAGKNKKTIGIKFPIPHKLDIKSTGENMEPGRVKDRERGGINLASQFQLEVPQLTLSGFLPQYNGTFKASDTKGIKAAINWNEQNIMTYELCIPIESFYQANLNTITDNPVLGFTIVVNGMSMPQHQGDPQGGGAASGGGPPGGSMGGGGMSPPGGGMPPGGMGGRPPSTDGKDFSSMTETTSIKFKIKLNGLVKK